MHQIFEDESFIYLMSDMKMGSSLNDFMRHNNNFINEDISLVILEQILLTIDFINERGFNLN